MTIKPLHDKVVLKMVEAEEKTKSGLILTASAQEKPQYAEVVAAGPGGMVDGVEVTPIQKNDRYYVELTDIAAKDLDEMHTFTVGELSLSYGVLSYVNNVVAHSTNEAAVNVAKALYAYYVAAEAYLG